MQGAQGPKGEKGEPASDNLQDSLVSRGATEDQGLPQHPAQAGWSPEPQDSKATWPDQTQISGGWGGGA